MNGKQWESYCSIGFSCTTDVSLCWFQLKIMQRILYTNKLLFIINVAQQKKCTFCNIHCETVTHLLCECVVLHHFIV